MIENELRIASDGMEKRKAYEAVSDCVIFVQLRVFIFEADAGGEGGSDLFRRPE